jgi:hypothetical protein
MSGPMGLRVPSPTGRVYDHAEAAEAKMKKGLRRPPGLLRDLRWKPMPGVGGRIVRHTASLACLPS